MDAIFGPIFGPIKFESALVEFCKSDPDRWRKIAAIMSGKSANEVKKRYNDLVTDLIAIDAGLLDDSLEFPEDHESVAIQSSKGVFLMD